MNSRIDDSKPLVFDSRDWLHTCGGIVERSTHYGESFCTTCDRTVPSKETRINLESLVNSVYNKHAELER